MFQPCSFRLRFSPACWNVQLVLSLLVLKIHVRASFQRFCLLVSALLFAVYDLCSLPSSPEDPRERAMQGPAGHARGLHSDGARPGQHEGQGRAPDLLAAGRRRTRSRAAHQDIGRQRRSDGVALRSHPRAPQAPSETRCHGRQSGDAERLPHSLHPVVAHLRASRHLAVDFPVDVFSREGQAQSSEEEEQEGASQKAVE